MQISSMKILNPACYQPTDQQFQPIDDEPNAPHPPDNLASTVTYRSRLEQYQGDHRRWEAAMTQNKDLHMAACQQLSGYLELAQEQLKKADDGANDLNPELLEVAVANPKVVTAPEGWSLAGAFQKVNETEIQVCSEHGEQLRMFLYDGTLSNESSLYAADDVVVDGRHTGPVTYLCERNGSVTVFPEYRNDYGFRQDYVYRDQDDYREDT